MWVHKINHKNFVVIALKINLSKLTNVLLNLDIFQINLFYLITTMYILNFYHNMLNKNI